MQAITTHVRWDREWFAAITELLEAGAVSPTVDTVFPLERAPDAHRSSEEKQARGKIILSTEDEGSSSN